MRKFSMTRRRFLRDLGFSAAAAPLLLGLDSLYAKAQVPAATKKRFLAMYTPNGIRYMDWRIPMAGADIDISSGALLKNPALNLSALAPNAAKLLILDRLSYIAARPEYNTTGGTSTSVDGKNHPGGHQKGMGCLLTGQPLTGGAGTIGDAGLANGISLDQVLAASFTGKVKFPSLQIGVMVNENLTDRYVDKRLSYSAASMPLPPIVDPFVLYNQVFSGLSPSPGGMMASNIRLVMDQSVLDDVYQQFNTLKPKVSQADWQLLQQHQAALRAIENQLTAVFPQVMCTGPTAPMAAGVSPTSPTATHTWAMTLANFPTVGGLMIDMIVQALACGLTNVITFQWANSEWDNTFPWLNVTKGHHGMSHAQDPSLLTVDTWYASQFNSLITKLNAIPESGAAGSVLDNSLLMYTSCLSHGAAHVSTNAPITLAGSNGGYFRQGRVIRFNNTFTTNPGNDQKAIGTPDLSNSDLMASILDSFGMPMAESLKGPAAIQAHTYHGTLPAGTVH
jgi:hypothetical protein